MTEPLSDAGTATDSAGGLLTIDLATRRANYRTLVRLAAPAVCGTAFTLTCPMRLATIAYADGWPRNLRDKGAAFAGDVRLPIVGRVSMDSTVRVSMDSTVVDISALAEDALHLGSLVALIGPHQTPGDVAALCGTIPYQILASLGRRYARRYIDHEAGAPASMTEGVAA